ncbi:hypothetical protein [Sessilibacter corallicola]|uniref:hypothetical protein n=1 Tax=Sessilibacter corallicola TaxID=2904075 RepID=UPI001E4C379F|nr:hypothetical protein [Sessilibacter corallicola]MCE2027446.1 hypothetical protein [Sessilibacter corallicola]
MSLRDEFLSEIKSAVRQCYELGYAPTRFEKMITESHPVEVAKSFVVSGEFQYGFKELNKMGRPELTVEGIMSQDKYKTLFTPDELAAAKWRLKNV